MPRYRYKKQTWLESNLQENWVKVAATMVLTTGYFIWTSTMIAVHHGAGYSIDFPHDNGTDLGGIFTQSAILALFLYLLHLRGWSFDDLKIKVSLDATLHTVPLLFIEITLALIGMVFMGLWAYNHQDDYRAESYVHLHSLSHYNWLIMFGSVVIDVLIEEVTAMCYLFNQIASRHGPVIASIIVLAVRMACHTWKPPFMVLITGIQFGIFCLWYWQTRNIWPLIITHVIFDVFWLYPEVR